MKFTLILTFWLIASPLTGSAQTGLRLQNDHFELQVTATNQLLVKHRGPEPLARPLTAQVWLQFAAQAPPLGQAMAQEGQYPVAAWATAAGQPARETDPFRAAQSQVLKANKCVQVADNQILFSFPNNSYGKLALQVSLPPGPQAPVFEIVFESQRSGYYSFAFAGVPAQDTAQVAYLYQPLVWSWRRFPSQPYLTPETYCTTAATFCNTGSYTEGVAPDPSEIPYRYASLANSRFGLCLRNPSGQAQPMLMAPVLGGPGSYLPSKQRFSFKTRYVLQPGDWYAGYQYILRNVFHYRNERQNAAVTLNQTLDNLLSFAMNDRYGGWVDSLKGFDYVQDAVGTVKIVSALHQVGAALATGSEEMYNHRALPTMEYALSREKYLYSVLDEQKIQSPSRLMKGPCVEIGELAGLHQMAQGQSPVFKAEMARIFGKTRKLNLNTETGGGTWQDYFARYQVSRELGDLVLARQGADEYLKTWQPFPNHFANDPGLRDKEAAFLTDFTPKLYDLFELYQETREPRYLAASLTAARQMLAWLRSHPFAPAGNLVVNRGGQVKGIHGKRYKVNSYDYLKNFYDTTQVAEQEIEAWRTSLVGLPPEQPRTYNNGPIMLTHHPAWLLRLAHHAQDTLLRDAAYNAILGRYANFPGYYFNSFETNVYQTADYPLHSYWEMRYNSMFYNHVFPHATLLIDFLVSDAFYRSKGQVDFPSVYAPGYAYLTSKVYGHQPGNIYGHENVRLWLPPQAIQSASVAFNYVLGVGKQDFFVVLTNTSPQAQREKIRLNPDVITWQPGRKYQVMIYQADGSTTQATLQNGVLAVEVPPQGLVVLKIAGLAVDVPLFRNLGETKTAVSAAGQPFLRVESGDHLGTISGQIIQVLPQFADAYIFTDKTEKELKKVVLHFQIGDGEWQSQTELGYPFEFSLRLRDPRAKVNFYLQATDLNGTEHKSPGYFLQNH
jgi:hypothetical protein